MFNDSTLASLKLGLDVSMQKQLALAYNIANVHTKGYLPFDVHMNSKEPLPSASVEDNLAKSLENNAQYRALLKGVEYSFSLWKLAMSGRDR